MKELQPFGHSLTPTADNWYNSNYKQAIVMWFGRQASSRLVEYSTILDKYSEIQEHLSV